MASIEKKVVETQYVLTLNQDEIDVLRTLMYYNLGGNSEARRDLEDAINPHGAIRSEWVKSDNGGKRVWTS